MAFVGLICTARKLNKLKQDLIDEKQDALKADLKKSKKKRWKHFWIDIRWNFKKRLKKLFSFPENSRPHRICYNLRHDGSCANFTLKSVVGFISGFLLTYLFFMFFVFQLNFKISTATIMCSILGCILTIGLAFSYKIRCIVLLTLPQFFSKKGRQALLAYAFILAITGPAKNTLNNMAILSESLACGQEQLKSAVRQIIEVVKKPFYAIKEAIKKIVKTVKEIVKKIKEILLKIKRVIMSIIKVIKSAFEFLGKILNICNKELGTPFERCSRVFENAVTDCNAKLGPMFDWLCSLTYIVKSVCYLVKVFDFVCVIVDFISNSIIGVVIRKVKQFIRHIRTMFYVRIKFSHSFHFQTNTSKTLGDISTSIAAEIQDRTKIVMMIFDFMTSAATIFFLFIVVRVCYYRFKFLTCERFDNKYISKDFINIDMRRARLGKETLLPFNTRERAKYIKVGSKRLVKTEKRQLSQAAVTLGTATLKLATHMAADYALFWVLDLIRYYAKFQSKVKAPNVPVVFVTGDGFLAKLLKSIVKAFQPLGLELEIDTIPCLPNPIPPDYDRYIQIASLLILCWFLAMLEPYGLRLRNTIMCYYHPTRGRERAIWLYNHILRNRSSFLQLARRQLKRKVLGTKGIEKVTLKEFLRDKINIRICRVCLGPDAQSSCLLCGQVFRDSDKSKAIRCQTPGCPGIYCEECFAELQNLCTVCLSPIDYGDLSDIDEEMDSSDEEELMKQKIKKKKQVVISSRKDDDSGFDHSDSDGFASDEYTYQYEEKTVSKKDLITKNHFKDLEKQHLPDYVTMESFRENLEEAPDDKVIKDDPSDKAEHSRSTKKSNKSLKKSGAASDGFIELMPIRDLSSDSSYEFDSDLIPLLTKSSSKKPIATSTPKPKPYTSESIIAKSSSKTDHSISSPSYSSVDTDLKRILGETNLDRMLPESELSFSIISETSLSPKPIKKKLSKKPQTIKAKTESPLVTSPASSTNSSDISNAQKDKIRNYYKSVDVIPKMVYQEPKEKKNKFIKFVENICARFRRKHKKETLPLYNQENIELRSYNYSEKNWDTLGNRTNSSSSRETSSSADDRIRGGGDRLSQIVVPLRIAEPLRSQSKTNIAERERQLILSKYSIRLEDFTPTKDFKILMPKTEPNLEAKNIRQRPEKDYDSIPLKHAQSTSNFEIPIIIQPVEEIASEPLINGQQIKITSSSELSYDLCLEILGKPCKNLKVEESQAPVRDSVYFTPPEEFHSVRSTQVEYKNPPKLSSVHKEKSLAQIKESIKDSTATEKLKKTDSASSENKISRNQFIESLIEKRNKKSRHSSIPENLDAIDSIKLEKDGEPIKPHEKEEELKIESLEQQEKSTIVSLSNKSDRIPSNIIKKSQKQTEIIAQQKTTEHTIKIKHQATNTSLQETPKETQYKSKKLQATEELIAYFDKTVNSCNCAKKTVCTCCAKVLEAKIMHNRMHCCCYCMDKDHMEQKIEPKYEGGARSGAPLPPDFGKFEEYKMSKGNPDSCCLRKRCSRMNATMLNQRDEENIGDTIMEEVKSKDTSTQTYPIQENPKCGCPSCNCGDVKQSYQRKAQFCQKPNDYCDCSSSSSNISECPDYPDYEEYCNCHEVLPYQATDDYLDLVQELEDTLVTRNRNRVRRAMEEFETRSRNNRPLEKPITNYDDISDSEEPLLQKLTILRSKHKNKCKCRSKEAYKCGCNSETCRMVRPNQQPQQQKMLVESNEEYAPRFQARCTNKTNWQMNPRTGEWFKVNEAYACRSRKPRSRSRSRTLSPHLNNMKEECSCCQSNYYNYRYKPPK